jgi:hypothetical protein
VASLRSRNANKKSAAKAKAQAKAQTKGPSVAKSSEAKAQAKGGKCKKEEVDKDHIMTSMPKLPANGTTPKPVRYKGGVIYTSIKTKSFRILTTSAGKYSEKGAKWGAAKPTIDAWKTAVAHIDKAYRTKK